jgi:two-component system heavy metal sensor histidine kinase CusS
LTWGLSLLTVLTLGAAFAAISVILDGYQERQLDHSLLEVARAEAEEAPANHFSFTSRPGPATSDVGPLDNYGVIFDGAGGVLAATRPFDTATPRQSQLPTTIDEPFDFTFAERRYRGVIVPIPGHPNHRLLLAASREDLDRDSRFVRRAMAIALAVSVAWLAGAFGWLIHRNMREHERIAEILHEIAAGNVKARVGEEMSDQQLRLLGNDVDAIARRLAVVVEHERRFIAHAAHELRSPLAALRGGLQQALRKERSGEDYRERLAFLLKASERLSHLADQLLDLARAEQSPAEPDAVPLDLAIAAVVESLEPLAREKGVGVERDPTDCIVQAATHDVERILRNLLDNAIRHSPSDGVVRIEVTPGDPVRIRVRDQGEGVASEERENVFRPFYRSPAARAEARGAGLGLAIARELARKHGGDVSVGDEASCFVVSLPRCRAT